jgi:3-hydroxyisobutyrate dehydrogenase-like beta-hydroxyacid dehydrogenase
MKTVGFIGLADMGMVVSENLFKSGFAVNKFT